MRKETMGSTSTHVYNSRPFPQSRTSSPSAKSSEDEQELELENIDGFNLLKNPYEIDKPKRRVEKDRKMMVRL
jgi:hypothetical protein